MDIVIYTKPSILFEKKGNRGGDFFYWTFRKPPLKFKVGNRIYFATRGLVRGSFKCIEFNPGDDETIVWHKDSWQDINKKISVNHAQGFSYRKWR